MNKVCHAALLSFVLLGGMAGGFSAANTAKANISNRYAQIAAIRRDLGHGIAYEYSGAVAESYRDTASNPEHPDILIRFTAGDQIVLTLFDQSQHNAYKPPKRVASIVELPESKLVVSIKFD